MTPEELDELAHEIAEDDCKQVLDGMTPSALDSQGQQWHDTGVPDPDSRLVDTQRYFVNRAVTYLDGAGILKRSPENPQWVSWDEDELDGEAGDG